MKRIFNATETFGHEYYDRIDEQLEKWENEPYEVMAEMEIAEMAEEDKARRDQAYLAIAEKLHNEMDKLRQEYLEVRKAYIEWSKVCVERGLF